MRFAHSQSPRLLREYRALNAVVCHEFQKGRVRLAVLCRLEFVGLCVRVSKIGGLEKENSASLSRAVFDFHHWGMGSTLVSGLSAAHATSEVPQCRLSAHPTEGFPESRKPAGASLPGRLRGSGPSAERILRGLATAMRTRQGRYPRLLRPRRRRSVKHCAALRASLVRARKARQQ
jgi:hypothetical protein